MSAFITLDRLGFQTADGRPLLSDLTFAFGRERTGLVGRNGVGKTTLIRLILGEADWALPARLEAALVQVEMAGYDGALLVVSHDRDFLAAVRVEREIRLPGLRRAERGGGTLRPLVQRDRRDRAGSGLAPVGP